jgi:hypothetical protein
LHKTLGKEFFLKNKNPSLPTAFARGSRHMFFFKIEKQPLPMTLPGALGTKIFFKKIKTHLCADGPASRPSAKKGSKTVNLTPRQRLLFLADSPLWSLGTCCAESLELECSAKNRVREKISRRACAESYSRQRLCREFDALCREF